MRCLLFSLFFLSLVTLSGCPMMMGPATDGLVESDFRPISLNGFDPEDNATDLNDYAWSMQYFVPDGHDAGFVYVGTGNDLIGLVYKVIASVAGSSDFADVETFPSEIRRYRGDIFPNAWERVFDLRDEENPFKSIGFRIMQVYRAESDGVNYLYTGTMSAGEIAVWRTATGEPGDWEKVFTIAGPGSFRSMEVHNGLLYFATANDLTNQGQPGKVYATDGDTVWNIIDDGFGNPLNTGIMALASFNNFLYAGTSNREEGFEIWKLEGPDKGTAPVRVVANGGPSSDNEWAGTAKVFQDYLYFGTQSNPISNVTTRRGADIIRLAPDDSWQIVVGPDSLSGYDSGFNHWPNTYIWAMEIHEGWLYATTYDQVSALFNMVENIDQLIAAVRKHDANIVERFTNAGADMYKSPNGIDWYPVAITGFGDVGNYGFRTLESVDGQLFVGTTNPFDGLEIWLGEP